METKICSACRAILPLSAYYGGNGRYGRRHRCRKCTKEYNVRYYQRNKARCDARQKVYIAANPGIQRDNHLRRLYGITTSQFNDMLTAQNGTCMICDGVDADRPLSVDHDHATGKIRGLLCRHCNRMLGIMKDNPVLLDRAAAYLRGHQ